MWGTRANSYQKSADLIETHGHDGAARIARANMERYVSGSDPWIYWTRVITDIDIRRFEKRTAKRLAAHSVRSVLAFCLALASAEPAAISEWITLVF